MDLCRGTVIFLLIIQLTQGFRNEKVFLEKHIRSDVDMTPVCTNGTDDFITKVQCKIQKGNNGSVSCSFTYVPGLKNESECSSRAAQLAQNQTVFLHLMDLTPEDSGTYYCECFRLRGMTTLHLKVTVEEDAPVSDQGKTTDDKNSELPVVLICSSVSAFIVISGVIVVLIFKWRCCRKQSQTAMEDGEESEAYAVLQGPDNDLYQTINNVNPAACSGSGYQPSLTEGEYENINYNTN